MATDNAITNEDFVAGLDILEATLGLDEDQFERVLDLDREVLHEEAHAVLDYCERCGLAGCHIPVVAMMVAVLAERSRQARVMSVEGPNEPRKDQ